VRVERIELAGFRCYESAAAAFADGVTAVVGPNGAGKTSLLEAVHLVLAGYSPRTTVETRCIRDGAPFLRVAATARDAEGAHELSLALAAGEPRRIRLDGRSLRSRDQLTGRFECLVFLPERLAVVQRAPAVRRAYLDRAVIRAEPGHAAAVAAYGRALAQRNALLRRIRAGVADAAGLDVWDEQLAAQGAALIAARSRLCARLAAPFAAHLETLGGRPGAILEYRPRVAADDLAAAIAERRERDITRAATSAGPHLDDVVLHEQARELRSFGSQGEQRTAVLALLLAEATLVTELRGEPPVLLLDDVLSELDPRHRQLLRDAAARSGAQVLVTTTDEREVVSPEFAHIPLARLEPGVGIVPAAD
jgi:DNA replication and repair protein RecF